MVALSPLQRVDQGFMPAGPYQLSPDIYSSAPPATGMGAPQPQSGMFGALQQSGGGGGMFGNLLGRVSSGISNNPYAFLNAGLGMLAGSNPQEGFANAMQGLQAGSVMDRSRGEDKKKRERERKWEEALAKARQDGSLGKLSGPVQDLMAADPEFGRSALLQTIKPTDYPSSYDEFQLAQNNPGYGDFLDRNRRAGGGYGTTPIYGTKNGKPAILQLGAGGTPIETPLPQDFELGPGVNKIDLGDSWGILDRNGQLTQRIPKNLQGAAAAEALGKGQGEAAANLPNAEGSALQMLSTIQSVKDDPYRARGTGLSSVMDPRNYIPGTGGKDFQAKADQLKGQAFLQAFATLKGGGQITEVEGQKATDAIARLSTAQSDDAYLAALNDLEQVVQAALLRSRQKAGEGGGVAGGGTTSSGVSWRVRQ